MHHQYEIAWAVLVGVLLLCTLVYAAMRRRSAEEALEHQAAGIKGLSRKASAIATGDGEAQELVQDGFVRSAVGETLFMCWCSLAGVGYLQLIWFTADFYLFNFHVPDLTWLQLAEPFLVVYLVSHAVLFFQSYKFAEARVFFMTPSTLPEASHVMMQQVDGDTLGTLCEVEIAGEGLRFFSYTCVRYLWDEKELRFRPGGVEHITAAAGRERWLAAGGLSEPEASQRRSGGPNAIEIDVPSLPRSVMAEFLSAIYIFQFCCIWVYMFYSTWNIATIWLVLALISGTTKAYLVRKSQLEIQLMARTEATAMVLRDSVWKNLRSEELVPGDVLVVEQGIVPCDIAILEGCAVVNESMLTGEPMPVQRFAVDEGDKNQELEPVGALKRSFLYAGTGVLQSSAGQKQDPNMPGRAIGIAVGTGARTAKGSMVRMVLFPSPAKFQFTEQLAKVYVIMVAFTCALFCILMLKDQGHWLVAVFTGLCVLTQSLQPNMPVSFTLAHSVSSSRLRADCGVACLNPPRIPIAGKVHVMVLDKTGTITKDGMDFAGARGLDANGAFAPLCAHTPGTAWGAGAPQALRWATAGCHTVTQLRDKSLVGNAVEVAMLTSSGWELSEDSSSVHEQGGSGEIRILRRLEFDHVRMTSGAVLEVPALGRTVAMVKGSYEKVAQLVSQAGSALPDDFKAVTEQHAADQYYVLGLGMKDLSDYCPTTTRDELEAGLSFVGLLLFRNEMKPDSPDALAELKAGGVRSVMCTGDNALTGIAIGRRCGMLGDKVVLGEIEETHNNEAFPEALPPVVWKSQPAGAVWSHEDVLASDAAEVDICLTKPAFKRLENTGEMEGILDKVRIYARMKPEDKVSVIHLHQNRGLVVGMVGDGGNDCGALRAAHVGIALSEAEASIVAPFSSREDHGTGSISLRAVPDLLRYGRAALATNLATYMYFMVYALAIPIAKFTCIFIGNMILSEWTWISTDIIVGSIMVAFMTLARPADQLAVIRPTSELLGWRTVATVLVPAIIYGICFAAALLILWQQTFYHRYDAVELGVPSHEWQKKGDNFECGVAFFFLSMQLPTVCFIYSHGAEHRKSPFHNIPLTACYLGILVALFCVLWGGPSEFSCVFRVNCDSYTSQRMYVPGVQEFSTGNLGGCFLGPQLMQWKRQLGDAFEFPDAETNGCKPSAQVNLEEEIRVPSGAISWLGAAQCRGPNNCFDHDFRIMMTVLLVMMVGATHGAGVLMSGWHPAPKAHFKKL